MNQDKNDFLLLNSKDQVVKGLANEAKSKIIFFSDSAEFNPNEAAVMTVGSILGIKKDLILKVFNGFKGIEHRMEYVSEINGVKFINDSKATLAESTMWALQNIDNRIVLICGGRHKGVDYGLIKNVTSGKILRVIVIGEAAKIIEEALAPAFTVEHAANLCDAVSRAYSIAEEGDSVLLSPMCSSFDMFKNYEERGRAFKSLVRDLSKA